MSKYPRPSAAIPAELPRDVRLQIVSTCPEIPEGDDWLHEIKHDGHRLLAIVGPDRLQLVSRNGYDRTALFREPFRTLAGLPPMVLDGEIAAPDDRGVTHIDGLSEAISGRRPDRLAYYAFDLLHFDGHDLRRCPLQDRKALLRDVIGAARCERIVYVDHVRGIAASFSRPCARSAPRASFSKRGGSIYRGGESRDWLKTKCHETGTFAITGFSELGEGRLEAIYVAESRDGVLCPAGQVRFGFAGKGLWQVLDKLRVDPARKGFVPVKLGLFAEVKFFGRYKAGFIRDGVILSIHRPHENRTGNVSLTLRGQLIAGTGNSRPMRQVEVRLKGWKIADAMAELRIWLDHNDCTPHDFEITKAPRGTLVVRVEFADDAMAEAFKREFAR
jgi:bifunctional non-homologous end joining protein LigD